MKRIIVLVLCLMTAVSACLAEEMPADVYSGKVKMYKKIPEKTMEKVFSGYMVPDCEKVFSDNSAWSMDPVIHNGEGWYMIPDPEILDNERIRACREIAETLLKTVYPEGEMELIAAMPCRDYIERDFERMGFWDRKDGQWYYLGKALSPGLEKVLEAMVAINGEVRERIDVFNPDVLILQYHPAPVCGLPVGLHSYRTEDPSFCLNTFVFDADNYLVSASLGGGFTFEQEKEALITVTEKEAAAIAAQSPVLASLSSYDWREYAYGPYDELLKELGYAEIRHEFVNKQSPLRLVMAVDSKGNIRPAWEGCEVMNVLADGKAVKECYDAVTYFYISAEDGSLRY